MNTYTYDKIIIINIAFYRGAVEWNQISNAVKPGGNFVVLGKLT